MEMIDIILDKRYGKALTDEQIKYFVTGVTNATIPDYQISSLLMAIVLNGMDEREMTTLTLEMAHSGEVNDLSYLDGIPVDKHSTGGVGDKITPILIPLLATFDVTTVKLSGRGLGFTGGTVDKFESIAGFNASLTPEKIKELAKGSKMVISGQTANLAPADKVLYALRDVTGTVDSIPLIASSIMSKKIAGGAKALVLDVTCGSGAFMKNVDDARALSEAMIKIGKLAGLKTCAIITDMDQPLGRCVGNVLEMQEVYETLTGRGSSDVIAVVTALAAKLVSLSGKDNGMIEDEIKAECIARLTDGRALSRYVELILSQGGSVNSQGSPLYVERPFESMFVTSPDTGYITRVRADLIGKASVKLGAGRLTKESALDYGAGICLYAKVGDNVRRGDRLCSICTGEGASLPEEALYDAMDLIHEAYEISDTAPESHKAVIDVLS
ncbi:MAG: thymidine phosphorylase [Saccharofermentans sp.]|nr:thymidine phosphorylase [Saccharofermentans sp.]